MCICLFLSRANAPQFYFIKKRQIFIRKSVYFFLSYYCGLVTSYYLQFIPGTDCIFT